MRKITLNNSARLLMSGSETLSAMKASLSRAERFINLEYFSFHDDETGRAVTEILKERASHGVKVRMLTDSAGSWRLGRKFIKNLRASGIEFRRFSPFTFHRDHRKIVTVDGVTGFLGGFNIGDVYLKQWRDTHLMLCGGAVAELDAFFASMWRKSGGCYNAETVPDNFCGDVPVRIIASGKGEGYRAVADEYIRVISSSKSRIWITTPYFAPDRIFLEALYSAVKRGVDVRVIIPSSSNHPIVSWASQSYVDEMLRGGVRVFVYRERFIHAKTMIVDDDIASVGTANLDALSFAINYEVQAFVYSREIVDELTKVFSVDLSNCSEENLSTRRKRPAMMRVKELAGRLLSPIL